MKNLIKTMKNLIKMMVLALSVSTMVLAPSNALADETNIANQWMVVDDYKFIKGDKEKTQVSLLEIVPEGTAGWVRRLTDNKTKLNTDTRDWYAANGDHTDIDFSMLDGSEGSVCKLTFINAFSSTSITSIKLPVTLTQIASSTFNNCSKLTYIEMPGVTTIGSYALGCSTLTMVSMPSLTTLESQFCRNASKLCEIKLPHCMAKFKPGVGIFAYSKVTTLYIHSTSPLAEMDDATINTNSGRNVAATIKRYGGVVNVDGNNWVYDNALWNADTTNYVRQASVVTLVAAKSLSIVGDEVQIPKKLPIEVEIDGDSGAETVSANAIVTEIEACAFRTNEELVGKKVSIPKSVTRIGVAAFPQGCYMKVKQSAHAKTLVDQLNLAYGQDDSGKPYASIDNTAGFVIIVK